MERRDEGAWVRSCQWLEVEGGRLVGRPRKTWGEVVREDMRAWDLSSELAQDRERRQRALKHWWVDTGKRSATSERKRAKRDSTPPLCSYLHKLWGTLKSYICAQCANDWMQKHQA